MVTRRFLYEVLTASVLFGMTIIALVVLISITVQVNAYRAMTSVQCGEGI